MNPSVNNHLFLSETLISSILFTSFALREGNAVIAWGQCNGFVGKW